MLYSFTSAVNLTVVTLVEGILFQFCIVSYPGASWDFLKWCKGSWEKLEALCFKHKGYPCAFAFLKLSHDPCVTTTVEKPKKRLGTRQLSVWNLDLASFQKFLRLSLARV